MTRDGVAATPLKASVVRAIDTHNCVHRKEYREFQTLSASDSVASRDGASAEARTARFELRGGVLEISSYESESRKMSFAERAQLLCCLTCGLLLNRYETGDWPSLAYRIQAVHRWLDAHDRRADWRERAKLVLCATELAERNVSLLQTGAGRWEMDVIVACGAIDYNRPGLRNLYIQCEAAVVPKAWPAAG
jgi:hypothetical protein